MDEKWKRNGSGIWKLEVIMVWLKTRKSLTGGRARLPPAHPAAAAANGRELVASSVIEILLTHRNHSLIHSDVSLGLVHDRHPPLSS